MGSDQDVTQRRHRAPGISFADEMEDETGGQTEEPQR